MICIYKITSPTNKINIGQTWDWIKRKSVYKRIACPEQKYLYNSLKKYGFEAHKIEILLILPKTITQLELDFYETYWWKYYKDLGYEMLNIKEPGSRGKLSIETRNKMSISLKALKGSHISNKTREAARKLSTGRVKSKDELQKLSIAHKGKIIPQEMRERIRNKLKGRKLSKETREKISKSNIGRKFSEETIQKIKETWNKNKGTRIIRRGKYNISSKLVIDLSTGIFFDSICEAEKSLNINKGVLVNKLNGRTKNNTSLKLA